MIVLDTNVLIDALDDPTRDAQLAAAIAESQDVHALSSVVLAEFLIGRSGASDVEGFVGALIGEVGPDKVLTPSHDDWVTAGRAMRSLGGEAATSRRSFWNDLLLAANCARVGATLLASNARDFQRIRRVIPVETVAAWRV